MSATGRRRGNTNLPIRLGNLPKRRRMSLCMTPPSCMSEPATKPRLLELALAFNKISLASFGGGLSAWARRVIVEEKKWLDDEGVSKRAHPESSAPRCEPDELRCLCWQPLPRLRGRDRRGTWAYYHPVPDHLGICLHLLPPQHDTCDAG